MENLHDKLYNRLSTLQFCKVNFLDGIVKAGDTIASPISTGRELIVYKNCWRERGSCLCGDIVDLCGIMYHDGDNGAAMRNLSELTGIRMTWAPAAWVEHIQCFGDSVAHWYGALSKEHREFLEDYGVKNETIERNLLGTITDIDDAGKLCIPHAKNKYFAYYTALDTKTEQAFRASKDEYIYPCLWGLQTLDYGDTLVLCSNPIQAILVEQEQKWAVLSPMSDNCSKAELGQIVSYSTGYKRVVVLFDGTASRQIARELLDAKIKFSGCQMRGIVSGKMLSATVDMAISGPIAYACGTDGDNIGELRSICRKASIQLQSHEVEEMISELDNTRKFNGDVLKSITRECQSCPSEAYVADEVLRHHKLAYNSKVGPMEHDGVSWRIIDDSVIHGYIASELGPWRSGSKCKTIATLVKAQCTSDQILNRKNIINFTNGALEIYGDKITFREHRAEDWCGNVTTYPYKPWEKSDDWNRFVFEIMDGDTRKMALLQEAVGYTLMADNRMQVAFFLQGDGGNGKSLLIEIIQKVLGESSVSHIKFKNLAENFQRVMLATSRLNICDESNSGDAQMSVDDFKDLVSGGTTSACFKGKDFIDFHCHSKFFVLCNTFPRITDTSDGFIRRCKVIKFNLKFLSEGEPTKPWERKGDPDLFEKLERPEVLSAVFNWALEGYRNIVRRKSFTMTSESSEAQNDLREQTNPLIPFSQNIPAETDKMTNDDLYKSYRSWCDDTGHKPMSSNSFSHRIGSVFRDKRPDLEPWRDGKKRGWRKIKD